MSLRVEVVSAPPSPTAVEAARMLREATQLQGPETIGDAIQNLRLAYRLIAKTNIAYPVEVYLRLPMYLQAAGRADEGWREFNALLATGYPNMLAGDAAWHWMEAAVYDKMRLFLERERRMSHAVTMKVLSIVAEQKADLARSAENSWVDERISQRANAGNLQKRIGPLMKRAGLSGAAGKVIEITAARLKELPDGDDLKFEAQIAAEVSGRC